MQFPALEPAETGLESYCVDTKSRRLQLSGAHCWYYAKGASRLRIQDAVLSLSPGHIALVTRGIAHYIEEANQLYALRIRRNGFAQQQRIDQRAMQIVEAAAEWAQRNQARIPLQDQELSNDFSPALATLQTHSNIRRRSYAF